MLNWNNEMSQMLLAFELQAKYSLSNIEMALKHEGVSFNAEFRQYFLRVTTNRIMETYDQFEINALFKNQVNVDTYGNTSAIDKLPVLSSMYSKNHDFLGTREATSGSVEVIDSSDEEDQEKNEIKWKTSEAVSTIQYDDRNVSPELHDGDHENGDIFEEKTDTATTAEEMEFNDEIPTVVGGVDTVTLTNESNIVHSTKRKTIAASTSKDLRHSAKNQMQMKMRFKCQLCPYSSYKNHINRHMRTHTGEKPYQCDICRKGFTTLQSVKRHKMTHTDEIPFHCRGCYTGFSQEIDQVTHERVCKSRRYECHICKKFVAVDKTILKVHMRKHNGQKPFRCEICMKRFTRKDNLKTHLSTIHSRSNL